MQTRMIGSLEVSAVGLGCNNFGGRLDEARTAAVVDAAIEHGITLFDTADIYGGTRSEEFLGRVLAGRRDQVVLATKFGAEIDGDHRGGASPLYVREAVEASLRRLQTDRIDLYQLHTPDEHTPIADTLGALDELVQQGKLREIGCSNFTAVMLREADEVARASGGARFVSVQNELSLLETDDLADALPQARALGQAYLPYFPLASGLLTGKFRRGEPPTAGTRIAGWPSDHRDAQLSDERWDRIEELTRFAEERGHTLLELAFAWLLAHEPVASVIAGATSAEQVRANVAAGEWRLDLERDSVSVAGSAR